VNSIAAGRPVPRERAKVGFIRVREADRIAEFKEVAELMPDDPVVRFGLAGAYLDAGKPENAADEYREAIPLKPDYSAAHRGLGRALERAGQIAEARPRTSKGSRSRRGPATCRPERRSRCFSAGSRRRRDERCVSAQPASQGQPQPAVAFEHTGLTTKSRGATGSISQAVLTAFFIRSSSSTLASARMSAAPSPRQALPCIQASVVGRSAASRSSMERVFTACA